MAGTFTLDQESRDGPWDELIGRMVGSYRIVRLLGRGGMGAVYLAKHPGIGSQVAIKFLNPRYSGDRGHVERFFNEARAVNVIGHENILKTLDFSVTPDGRYFFVMEFLSGKTLGALPKPVPLAEAGPIFLQCCRALQAAHERGIVHRDLKPDNVFLISQMGRKNVVKLVDFGIAKLTGEAGTPGMTEAGALIGTPEYMAPEQAAGRVSEIGRRSDVYSLGVVMYQLATGRVPFSGASTAETLVAQMQQAPPAPRSLEPSIPEEYEQIILRALQKRREDRFQSMAELHSALVACLGKLGLSAELPPADAEPERPPEPETPAAPSGPEPRAPTTGTFAGDRAPMEARLDRALDWALAPSRRARTLLALLGVLSLAGLWLWPRSRGSGEPRTQAQAGQAQQVPPRGEAPRAGEGEARSGAAQASAAAQPPPPKPARAQPEPAAAQHKPAAAQQKPAAAQQRPAAAQQKPAAAQQKPAAAQQQPAAVRQKVAAAEQKPAPPGSKEPAAKEQASRQKAQPANASAPGASPKAAAPAASQNAAAAAPAVAPAAPASEPLTAAAAARLASAHGKALQEMQDAAAKEPPSPTSAKLFVVSDPLGATATASWSGKSASGPTPIVFRVRKGAAVTLSFSKQGYQPEIRELKADGPQAVDAALKHAP